MQQRLYDHRDEHIHRRAQAKEMKVKASICAGEFGTLITSGLIIRWNLC